MALWYPDLLCMWTFNNATAWQESCSFLIIPCNPYRFSKGLPWKVCEAYLKFRKKEGFALRNVDFLNRSHKFQYLKEILSPYTYQRNYRELVQSWRIIFRATEGYLSAALFVCSKYDTSLKNFTTKASIFHQILQSN